MRKLSRLITSASLAALVGAATPVWAESAPVFDVDSLDSASAEQTQDLPMPPPPGEEPAATHQVAQGNSTFVPVQTSDAPAPAAASAPGVQAASPSKASPAAVDPAVATPGASVSTANLTPEQRMRRLEQQLNNLQSGEKTAQVESLQSEVQSLRGQIEQLNHQLEKVQAEQKTVKPEEGKRLAAGASVEDDEDAALKDVPVATSKKSVAKKSLPVAPKAAETTISAASATKDQPDVAEEQKAYQTAYDQIKSKKYPDAVETLQGMLKKYPSGQFASNAHYWLGELYGLMGKNDEALTEFSAVINKFPGSPRVSDAELKIGLILAAQSKWAEAKKSFKKIVNTYPGTASSRLASEQLKQIKLAGH